MADALPLLLWFGIAATFYAYAGFPLLATLLGALRPRQRAAAAPAQPSSTVTVTVLIPAYNEENSIGAKIENTLASHYPAALLDIVVISDASTDRTNEIARSFRDRGVRLLVQEQRRGKTAGLNRAVADARGTVLVFTDANAMFQPGTIAALVQHLEARPVGLVSGYTRYTLTESGDVAEVTNLYTALEWRIKRAESRWGSCVGADGAIFAMRRALFRPLREDDINDFVLPLGVVAQGFECRFADDAYCSEKPGENIESEFRRQSRITNRTLRALWRNRRLLNPFRFPVFAFFLFSHKVLRFLVPLLLCVSGASLALLAVSNARYLGAALVALLLAGIGAWGPRLTKGTVMRRATSVLHAFVTINTAILNGWWKFLQGRSDVTWQHDRSPAR